MVSLELVGVGVSYGRREILAGITTPPLRGGEVVAVIGPNAAGKSSLFRRIAGLTRGPGEVRVGSSTGRVPCYLPQDMAVNAVLTVHESVLLAKKQDGSWRVSDDELAAIDAVLRALAIEDLAFRSLGELSGGQRQLVSIAQTLAREPEIVLLDEPTSALDLHRQFEVLSLVRRLASERGLCVLISLHDLNQALQVADRVMMLAGGRLAALGSVAEVITPALLAEVYGIAARMERTASGAPYVVVEGSLKEGVTPRQSRAA
ncbi:ABC-type cobalamin/Fe3+-siderophores transport system, ATPase component [Chelatococcus sambhunathii]|uniref:ABC-type cobalamin/Fe3+-siderophores transport system, ATPase component n=1 Tax=Chelatococcus sambhunathii TaxID=363953 RepID=A0ABM9U5K4_9HYPH|nr:ABC transporter ATP-binding protein [Chelatococcus sambhunathii]CUA87569.1 ABC-type cobalamin/Fe3+-siderophores transport system, ATPase component [Chelatococcus sambhunathii]